MRTKSKKQERRHRGFIRAVRNEVYGACPVISQSEISFYLGRYFDIEKAAKQYIQDHFK